MSPWADDRETGNQQAGAGVIKALILEGPRQDRPLMALGLLLAGVLVLSFQDMLVKQTAADTSFWQLQSVRSAFNLSMILGIAYISGGVRLAWPARPKPALARGLALTFCMVCFFGVSQKISVAQMATGLYTYPLFVSLLAGPFLGERIGIWRIFALCLGAAGCLLVLNPFGDAFSLYQAVPVMAGFFYAWNILILRRYCRQESPLALVFIVSLMFLCSGLVGAAVTAIVPISGDLRAELPFLLVSWPSLTMVLLVTFLGLSCLNIAGNICISRAYQTADSSRLAPLDFTYLLFVALWGRLFFDEWPTLLAGVGMAMIAVAGIITAMREQRQQRLRKMAGTPA